MKLIYIAHARIPTEKAHGLTIVKSCEAFARAGADVTLMLPRRKTPLAGDLFDVYGIERIFQVMYLISPDLLGRFPVRGAFFFQTTVFYIRVCVRLLFAQRKETILYTRDATLITPLSILGFKVVYECHHVSQHRSSFFLQCRRALCIVVISKALRGAFIEAGFNEKNILVAPSGVDLSTFDTSISREAARDQLALPVNARIAVYTGNFTTFGQDKGLHDSIAAIALTPDVILCAVGGSETDQVRYAKEAREAGVEGRVILAGYTPQTKLALYQKAADILLMPFPDTPHYRNHMSPVKMFEYMASDRPIIASGLPTIREVLNETNAVLIPPGDRDALAHAIVLLLDDSTHARRLAEQARADVKVYSWEERAVRTLGFLKNHASRMFL